MQAVNSAASQEQLLSVSVWLLLPLRERLQQEWHRLLTIHRPPRFNLRVQRPMRWCESSSGSREVSGWRAPQEGSEENKFLTRAPSPRLQLLLGQKVRGSVEKEEAKLSAQTGRGWWMEGVSMTQRQWRRSTSAARRGRARRRHSSGAPRGRAPRAQRPRAGRPPSRTDSG